MSIFREIFARRPFLLGTIAVLLGTGFPLFSEDNAEPKKPSLLERRAVRSISASKVSASYQSYEAVIVEIDLERASTVSVEVQLAQRKAKDVWQAPKDLSQRTILLPTSGGRENDYTYEIKWKIQDEKGKVEEGKESINDRSAEKNLWALQGGSLPLDSIQSTIDDFEMSGKIRSSYSLTPYIIRRTNFGSLFPDRWQALPHGGMILLDQDAWDLLETDQRTALIKWARYSGDILSFDEKLVNLLAAQKAPAHLTRTPQEFVTKIEAIDKRNTQGHNASMTAALLKSLRIPLEFFIGLTLLFVLVVGPGCIVVALKSGRRYLLLILTPTISVITCILLATFNFLSEGISIKAAPAQMVIYDVPDQRVMAWSTVEYFAPFGIDRMQLEGDDAVYDMDGMGYDSVHSHHYYWDVEKNTNRMADWSEDQSLSGTWVPTRTPSTLGYFQERPLRSGLRLIAKEDGSLVLVNGLEQTINSFNWFIKKNEAWHLTSPVAPGETAQLEPGSGLIPPAPPQAFPYPAMRAWRACHRPGGFRATIEGNLMPIPGPEFVDHSSQGELWYLGGQLNPEAEQ